MWAWFWIKSIQEPKRAERKNTEAFLLLGVETSRKDTVWRRFWMSSGRGDDVPPDVSLTEWRCWATALCWSVLLLETFLKTARGWWKAEGLIDSHPFSSHLSRKPRRSPLPPDTSTPPLILPRHESHLHPYAPLHWTPPPHPPLQPWSLNLRVAPPSGRGKRKQSGQNSLQSVFDKHCAKWR